MSLILLIETILILCSIVFILNRQAKINRLKHGQRCWRAMAAENFMRAKTAEAELAKLSSFETKSHAENGR